MSLSIGRRGALGVGIEAVAGTTTAVRHFIPFLSCDLVERHTPIGDVSAKGIRDEQGSSSVEGKKWGEGSIEVILDPITCGYWFALVLGDVASSILTTVYTHEMTRTANNTPRTATIYRDRVVDAVKFPNSVVNSLELNFADDVAKLTMDVLSKYPIVEGGETPTYIALDLYTFKNVYVELATSGTTTSLKVKECTLTIDNNAEAVYAPNSNNVNEIISKQFNVAGSFAVNLENTTQISAFTDLTKQNLQIVFEKDTSKIIINIPQFRVDTETIDTPIDDISQETVDFVAEYDGTTTGSIKVTVVNETVASYL